VKTIQSKTNKIAEGEDDFGFIRILIWVYFFLLLLEGSLRKWFLPSLSSGLLIIRDPIVIWIYFLCYQKNIFPLDNIYIKRLLQWVILASFISLLLGTNLYTIAYGARTNLLHFPLIFILGRVLSKDDVINFAKAFLLLSAPMTILVSEQFQADREDILNVAAGGSGYQLETSGGKVRASGTFSFVSGIVYFYCFTVAFIIWGFLNRGRIPLWMLYLGISSSLLAMVTAGSRTVIAESLQVIACFAFLAYIKPGIFGKITFTIFGFGLVAGFLYFQADIFKEGFEFLSLRFEEAANVEGNPIEAYFLRYWTIIGAPFNYPMSDITGYGLGSATRAGASFGGYFWTENPWGRHLLENGIIIGSIFIAWRIWITKDIFKISINEIYRGNYLPIFLLGACGPALLTGLLGQPTTLGFAIFGSGLCLASTKRSFS
jgi:hypothetical protein